jgi:hypothetical protein
MIAMKGETSVMLESIYPPAKDSVIPTRRPPSTAPGRLVRPPTTAAANPLMKRGKPISG